MLVLALALSASAGIAADGQAGAAPQSAATNGSPALLSAAPADAQAKSVSPGSAVRWQGPGAGAQTNLYKDLPQPWGKRGVPKQPLAMNTPAPGVYETRPYTCIVIVPGAHPDDRMAHWNGAGESNMPVITPELQFIPHVSK